ncbi:MAG: hypothetical protein HUK22_02615 [Thermoguttaceae bacterium]|nr:hypothetical protein [Thermoguttaceae bacterium]
MKSSGALYSETNTGNGRERAHWKKRSESNGAMPDDLMKLYFSVDESLRPL